MAEYKKTKKQNKIEQINENLPLEGMKALLDSTKGEYEYLQRARNGLHTRVGILIALLTTLVSSAFIKEMPGLIELFQQKIIIAHIRVISLLALFGSFFIALLSYVRVFRTNDYYVFSYYKYTDIPIEKLTELSNEQLIMLMYREYANCILHNEKLFNENIKIYKSGNKWLIATIVFTIISIIVSII